MVEVEAFSQTKRKTRLAIGAIRGNEVLSGFLSREVETTVMATVTTKINHVCDDFLLVFVSVEKRKNNGMQSCKGVGRRCFSSKLSWSSVAGSKD